MNWSKVTMSDYEAEVEDFEQDSRYTRKGHDHDVMLELDSTGVRRSMHSCKPPPPKEVVKVALFLAYIMIDEYSIAINWIWLQ